MTDRADTPTATGPQDGLTAPRTPVRQPETHTSATGPQRGSRDVDPPAAPHGCRWCAAPHGQCCYHGQPSTADFYDPWDH